MTEGARLEYRIRWLGIPLHWVTRITRFFPEIEFQDVQEKGPYRVWIHTHRFEQLGPRVVIHDRVDYALPLGQIGRIAHRLVIRPQLEQIFDFRRRAVEEIFANASR